MGAKKSFDKEDVENNQMSEFKSFFIAIGPPKTGTSWFYYVLNQHKEVKLPRDKEVRYFWAKEFLGRPNLWKILFDNHWHYRIKRGKFRASMKAHIRSFFQKFKLDIKGLIWDVKYFFGGRTDRWYYSLFPDNFVTGDISPKYCELSDRTIASISQENPEAKIIISLRNPIERDWSRVKMNLYQKKNHATAENITLEEVKKYFEKDDQVNDYHILIDIWKKYFKTENVFVYYYEEIKSDPKALYLKICQFFNLSTDNPPELSKKVNEGLKDKMPNDILEYLKEKNKSNIQAFYQTYPNDFTKEWVNSLN